MTGEATDGRNENESETGRKSRLWWRAGGLRTKDADYPVFACPFAKPDRAMCLASGCDRRCRDAAEARPLIRAKRPNEVLVS